MIDPNPLPHHRPDPTSGPSVLSVNVGAAVPSPHTSAETTGIDKRPVPSIDVRAPGSRAAGFGSGVVGDGIGDRRHHGGDAQAVYAFAREELARWERELGRVLPPGAFGENLTTIGYDIDAALIGERWQVGTAVLVVTGPRVPCRTFAGHMGEPRWVKRFTDHGRTGAYLSVEQPGTIRPGDRITVLDRPPHDVDVVHTFRAYTGDLVAARRVVEARSAGAPHHPQLEDRLAARSE